MSSPSTSRFAVLCWSALVAASLADSAAAKEQPRICGGELQILGSDGQPAGVCPLKHTDVQADIAGFLGRVTVRQTFHNPTDRKIEAVYVFPLPQDAAVDDMVMLVGDRRIVGQVKERSEAREIYEAARAAGHVAGLLDQERPNIFTQSVANIEPGATVEIEIRYVETLKYEDGVFEWVFPMVVGPRYIPGGGSAPAPLTPGTPTPQVPDADKITPPVTPQGTRAGHDISLTVSLDAGMELFDLECVLHEVDVSTISPSQCVVSLKNQAEIPNKDFVLRYRLATDQIGDAFLVHRDERGSFFTLILQPPRRVAPQQLVPRELVFVLDTSGSMQGFPIEKAKQVMSKLIDTMHAGDTFNVITFSGDTRILWDAPRPNTPENRQAAQEFLAQHRGAGGTEMMTAINAALVRIALPEPPRLGTAPIRVVCFMTDGYVGNDFEIIDAVRKNADTTRVFSFGIGNSVNRFLLDGMAHAGRGEVEYVTLASQAEAAVERFHERVLAPVLTDVEIDWGGLPVADVYPQRVPDLFSSKPIVVHGRLTGPAQGTVRLRGNTGSGPYEDTIAVAGATPAGADASAASNPALPSLWARSKVTDLMNRDLAALQRGSFPDELKQQIIALGVEFRLVTQFTSFVAVEELTVTVGGEPTKVLVPVEMPDGVSYEGVFGAERGCVMLGAALQMSNAQISFPVAREAKASPAPAPGAGGFMWVLGQARADILAPGAADREGDCEAEAVVVAPATSRLAEPLRGLAEKVQKEGKDGTLATGGIKVVGWRVDVMVFLRDLSEKTLAGLKELGFVQTGESKAARVLIGSIDVRKLEELAKLEAVVLVRPVGAAR